jgi:hypothetical protein
VLFLIATVAIKNNDILMYVNSAQLNRKYWRSWVIWLPEARGLWKHGHKISFTTVLSL